MSAAKEILTRLLNWQDLFYFSKRSRFRPMLELRRFDPFALALCTTFRQLDNLRFCQIGANDGKSGDPIFDFATRFRWKGQLYEPVPTTFAKLVENYKAFPNCQPVNEAVGLKAGMAELFYVNNDGTLPEWTSQIASFDKQHLLSHVSACPGITTNIQSMQVPIASVNAVLGGPGRDALDVLLIDAEGYDYTLLAAIEPAKLPDFVSFEFSHMSQSEWSEIQNTLAQSKFELWLCGRDAIAFRKRD
jgi:FkbM family methyltransferase